jgi:hypothetical protein
MIPTPMKTETKYQFVKRCRAEGIKDATQCIQAWIRESKKTK